MDDARMSFREHLLELRTRLRNSVIALLVTTAVAYFFKEILLALLVLPLAEAMQRANMGPPELNYGALLEPFWVYFKLAIYTGIFAASPIIFHQIWSFIAPGLYAKEKRIALPFAIFSGLFFIGGALFCYLYVFPAAFDFFLSFSTDSLGHLHQNLGFTTVDVQVGEAVKIKETLFLEQYLSLTTKMLIAFGLIFELPLLIFFLSWVGLVTHRSLWKFNKYAVVLSFVIGALLTPGPDVISQMLMAGPMIVLYNLSIIIAFVVTRRREREAAGDGAPPDDDEAK